MPKQNQNPNSKISSPQIAKPTLDLRIDSMAFGGKGVARLDGKVYFVEDSMEGDFASVQITEETDRYSEGRVVRLIEPSPLRGSSPCPVSEQCGGCQWQGVPYAQQMVWKKQFVVNSLRRIGKLVENIEVEALPSPIDNGYRNRIFVRARILPDGSLKVGYFRRGSREFVAVTRCAIADDRINDFIGRLERVSFKNIPEARELTSEVKFRFEMQDLPAKNSSEPHILISVQDTDQKDFPVEIIIRELAKIESVAWIGGTRDLPAAPFLEFESDLGVKFHTAAGMFQQINIPHNHTVRRLVKDAVDEIGPKTILDVFCGSGNLSLPLADGKRKIDGIEFSKRAIEAANFNIEQGKIQNTRYFSGDTEKFLWRATKEGSVYDLVIADPPREGMYSCLVPLMKLMPRHIIYVSCDPTTLARDLGVLCKSDYRVKRFLALDFFPNTYHIESFVVLERVKS